MLATPGVNAGPNTAFGGKARERACGTPRRYPKVWPHTNPPVLATPLRCRAWCSVSITKTTLEWG